MRHRGLDPGGQAANGKPHHRATCLFSILLRHVWLKGEVEWEVMAHIFMDEVIHRICLDGWIWRLSFFWLDEQGWMEIKFIN
jgi:hypothetical protein